MYKYATIHVSAGFYEQSEMLVQELHISDCLIGIRLTIESEHK